MIVQLLQIVTTSMDITRLLYRTCIVHSITAKATTKYFNLQSFIDDETTESATNSEHKKRHQSKLIAYSYSPNL